MDAFTMTPSQPIMTLVSERYAQTMIIPEIIEHKYVYICRVVFTDNQALIEVRYFKTFENSITFAQTRNSPDPVIRISIHIYGIPFEKSTNNIDEYYINSLHN